MYFKELKLFGFKSFAEETSIKFEPGVTAIVGPNGCGKSNLADAVKWVLGEQSAKEIRGSGMEDVIFNGTAGVDPVNIAEVSLTILNDNNILPIDYDEVTITRRVYRSGESDYFINKSKVRLRDVQDIIMGTGIGKSAYSIMEQGKIDLILSSKPQDRRYVFEEASGITKYKSKKKETLNKLERTQENLQRLNDIIQEVERQLNSIDRKVKKAQRYKHIYEKMKKYETIFSKNEYIKIQEVINQKKFHSKEYLDKVNEIENNIKDFKNKLDNVKLKAAELTDNLDSVQNKLVDVNSAIKETESISYLSKARIKDLTEKIDSLDKEEQELTEKNQITEKDLNDIKLSMSKLEGEKHEIRHQIELHNNRINDIKKEISDDDNNIENIKVELVDEVTKETNIKNDIVRIDSDIKNYNNRLVRLNAEKNETDKEIQDIKLNIEKLESDINILKSDLAKKEAELQEKTKQANVLQHEFKKIELEIKKDSAKLKEVESKYELFKQLKEKYEGFSSAIKKLVEKKQEEGLNFEILAEILNVEKGYEQAVESVLSEEIQSLIVEDRSEAVKIMNVLDNINEGKCKIIILNEYVKNNVSSLTEEIRSNNNVIDKLGDFVNVSDEKYSLLMFNIFKDKYLVKDRQIGLDISEKTDFSSCVFVTLNGEVFRHGCFLTRGDNGKKEFGLIGREEIIRELNSEIQSLKESLLEKQKQYKDLEDKIDFLNSEILEINKNITLLKDSKRDKENSFTHIQNEYSKFKEELTIIISELEEVKEELSDFREQKKQKEEQKNVISESIEKNKALIKNHQDNIINLNQEKEKLIADNSELASKLSGMQEKKASDSDKIDMLARLLEDQKQKLNISFEQKKLSNEKIKQLHEEIKNSNEKIQEITTIRDNLGEKLVFLRSERQEINKKREDLEKELDNKLQILDNQRYELQNINMSKTELEYKVQQLQDRILDKYDENLKDFKLEDYEESQNPDYLKLQIDKFSKKIESMGPVNLMAIEEHEELKERHSFLIDQKQDLLEAEESLRKAIKKINKTTRNLFMETFEKIRVEFDKMFRTLFGGGKAVISLEDEKDVLESGVMINAQPKGKKLQNISLLSGGEKTLTAVALLFAIFKVKPSPFYLLDEIDAALDEANIDRFSRLLKTFTENSQFIIITHNKKTISLADIIYGVTMEKSGISKLVSVKLVDKKELNTEKKVTALE